MLHPSRFGRSPLTRLVSQVLVLALVVGLLPAPAKASIPAPERPRPPAALPFAESFSSAPVALAVAVLRDAEAAPCTVVFAVVDPHLPSKYHRARWMDPGTGRFASVDPFEGIDRTPVTLHRYLYVGDDPVNKVDPTGEFVDSGSQLTAALGANTIRATSTITFGKLLLAVGLAGVAGAQILGPIAALREFKERGVPTDLYAFGNRTGPRGARPKDFGLSGNDGPVGPEAPPNPRGMSAFGDPLSAPVRGHYHRLLRGLRLPVGLAVIADGSDVGGSQPPTHHTIYPVVRINFSAFQNLVLGLPWEYAGFKP